MCYHNCLMIYYKKKNWDSEQSTGLIPKFPKTEHAIQIPAEISTSFDEYFREDSIIHLGFIRFCNEDSYLWGKETILCLPLNQGLVWQASAQNVCVYVGNHSCLSLSHREGNVVLYSTLDFYLWICAWHWVGFRLFLFLNLIVEVESITY